MITKTHFTGIGMANGNNRTGGLRRVALAASAIGLLAMAGCSVAQSDQKPAAKPAGTAPMAAAPANTARAIVAGGCFWCVEADYDKIKGVISTTSGYIGGKTENPTYEQVSANQTGHAEAVEIVYDPAVVSYKALVDHFWYTIDPTTKDRQFCDAGSPYRTVIFPVDQAQLAEAQASKARIEKSKPFKEPIVTEIQLAGAFYPAEGYHQDYYLKNPIRYNYYRSSCGRDARLKQLWGDKAAAH